MNTSPTWWHNSHHSIQSRRGKAGGLKAAANRRYKAYCERLALDRQWPPCPVCGARTHMDYCAVCDASVATL